jgi:hypothetical protein
LYVETQEAISSNSLPENGLPVEVTAHHGGSLKGGAEGNIHSLLIVHHDLFELQLVKVLQLMLQRLSHTHMWSSPCHVESKSAGNSLASWRETNDQQYLGEERAVL